MKVCLDMLHFAIVMHFLQIHGDLLDIFFTRKETHVFCRDIIMLKKTLFHYLLCLPLTIKTVDGTCAFIRWLQKIMYYNIIYDIIIKMKK